MKLKLRIDPMLLAIGPTEVELPDEYWDAAMPAFRQAWKRQRKHPMLNDPPGTRPWAWWEFECDDPDAPNFCPDTWQEDHLRDCLQDDPNASAEEIDDAQDAWHAAMRAHDERLFRYLVDHGHLDAREVRAIADLDRPGGIWPKSERRQMQLRVLREKGLAGT